jgi:hypothetical protein
MILPMRALLNLIRWMLLSLVRSRISLEAENGASLDGITGHRATFETTLSLLMTIVV